MHQSSVQFLLNLTKNKNLNMLTILKEKDLHNIVGVTLDVYSSRDLIKLHFHLQTLQNLISNSDKVALMLCQNNLVASLNQILFYLNENSTN